MSKKRIALVIVTAMITAAVTSMFRDWIKEEI